MVISVGVRAEAHCGKELDKVKTSSVWVPRGHTTTLGGEMCVGREIVATVITVRG